MGKESRLKNVKPDNGNRSSYTNGDRKFYDSTAAPAGSDEYVWSLALYFEQRLEPFGGKSRTPVTYTRLYERVSKDPDLTSLLDHARLPLNTGEGGKALVTSATKVQSKKDIVSNSNTYLLLEYMIDSYYNTYSSNTLPSIEDFSSYTIFNSIKGQVLEEEYIRILHTSGTKVPVVTTGNPLPDKRSPELQEVLDITVNRVYTGDQMEEAFKRFRRES